MGKIQLQHFKPWAEPGESSRPPQTANPGLLFSEDLLHAVNSLSLESGEMNQSTSILCRFKPIRS
jgi:hypothetical protein